MIRKMTNKEYIKYLEDIIKIYERKDKQATETSIAYNELLEENEKLKEELKEICEKYLKIKTTVSAYEDACKDSQAYIKKLKEEVSRESYKVSEAYCLVEELKELLKECESSIQYYQETYGAMDLDTYTLLAKLKEALK